MLHKFNYAPIAQPILAAEMVRSSANRLLRGADSRRPPRILPIVAVEIEETSVLLTPAALAADALRSMPTHRHVIEGAVKTAKFDRGVGRRAPARESRYPLAPAETRPRWSHAPAHAYMTGRATDQPHLPTQMPHLMRTPCGMTASGDRSSGHRPDVGALRAENVARTEFVLVTCSPKLRTSVAGRRTGAKTSRLLPQPRSVHHA